MRRWSGFKAGTEEAILPVASVMSIVSTPRHTAKLSGHYVSSAPEYGPLFVARVREVTRGAAFWAPRSG